MKFLRNHWYDIGVIPFVISLIYLIFNWNGITVLQRLALMNFMVIFWHQFEEYRFPGGETAILNLAVHPEKGGEKDRFPLNQNNALFINILAAYIVYFLPVVFPDVMWLGLMPVLFGIAQFGMHSILTPRKIGNKIYSPGTLAVVFGYIPVGGYWLYYTGSNGLLDWINVIGGIAYLALFIVIVMRKLGYGLLKNPNSPYPFPEEEFERGGYAKRISDINKQRGQ